MPEAAVVQRVVLVAAPVATGVAVIVPLRPVALLRQVVPI
jgi:hypothetical protein